MGLPVPSRWRMDGMKEHGLGWEHDSLAFGELRKNIPKNEHVWKQQTEGEARVHAVCSTTSARKGEKMRLKEQQRDRPCK